LGFVWDPYQTSWDQGLNYLEIYKEREGHCCVPRHHNEIGFPLGQWVHHQRVRAKNGTISIERRKRLDALGFVWNVQNEPVGIRPRATKGKDETSNSPL
jgi:hypothetical protein